MVKKTAPKGEKRQFWDQKWICSHFWGKNDDFWRKLNLFTLLRKRCVFWRKINLFTLLKKCPFFQKTWENLKKKQHFWKNMLIFLSIFGRFLAGFCPAIFFRPFFFGRFIMCFWTLFFGRLFWAVFFWPVFGEAGGRLKGGGSGMAEPPQSGL